MGNPYDLEEVARQINADKLVYRPALEHELKLVWKAIERLKEQVQELREGLVNDGK